MKYLIGTNIIEWRPEVGVPDCISGNYIIIDSLEGFDNWKDSLQEEHHFTETKDNLFSVGMIYNKLLVLNCGSLYCAQDIRNLENIDKSIFTELLKKKEIDISINEYFIYYFSIDYVYHKDIVFLVLPYLDEDLIRKQPNFISYQIIKKNKIFTHIKHDDV